MQHATASMKHTKQAGTSWSQLLNPSAGLLQRKCACGGDGGAHGECESCATKKGLLQRKGSGDFEQSEVPPIVHEVLRSPGHPLDATTRAFMEPRFGHDFSRVRVHTDIKAADSARAGSALAYTVGYNVVFGENNYAPTTPAGRELLTHELAHTIQQRYASGPLLSGEPEGIFEASANAAARNVAQGDVVSIHLPASGLQIQREPVNDLRWKNDVKAARYRGQLVANRIKKHGKLSSEARAKINQELAYFEGAAKETYLQEVKPILKATAEIEMPEEPVTKKVAPPRPITLSLLPPDPRLKSDEELKPPLTETEKEEQKEREQEIESEKAKLRKKTAHWPKQEQEFALSLLTPLLNNTKVYPTAIDPRAISDKIRRPILDRYRHWLEQKDKELEKVCQEMKKIGGVYGFILRSQAGFHPQLDPCRRWFADEDSHGPSELRDLERHLKLNRFNSSHTETPAEYIYYDVFEYRKKTDPLMLEQEQIAGEMVSGAAGAVGAIEAKMAAAEPTVPVPTKPGIAGFAPDIEPPTTLPPNPTPSMITPSRPVAGFVRDIEPTPAPVAVPASGTVSTQMPRARVVQGNEPTYGNVKPAFETPEQAPATTPSRRVVGFQKPPKDVTEKGLVEVEMGPREYIKREYFGDIGAAGEQQSRYHVNIQLNEQGMMEADVVLREGGRRSGSLFGKEEFLEAKRYFEQRNGPGSVKGVRGRWGGGDNLETFNSRFNLWKGRGLSHEAAMSEAAKKTKTGEWAAAADFKNVKITKTEGSPGAFTNVEVEFTK